MSLVDRSIKDIKAKEYPGVECNNGNGPKTRSYFKKMEQGSLVRSPEFVKISSSYTTDDLDILK